MRYQYHNEINNIQHTIFFLTTQEKQLSFKFMILSEKVAVSKNQTTKSCTDLSVAQNCVMSHCILCILSRVERYDKQEITGMHMNHHTHQR